MSPRWRWIIPAIVPAAILLIGGAFAVWPAWSSWRRLLTARIDAVDEQVVRSARAEVDRLETAVAEGAAKSEGAGPLPVEAARIETIAAVRGLTVVSSDAQGGGAGAVKLAAEERARLRRLVLAGSYAQVVALVSTLAEQPRVLVVSVTLDHAPRDGQPALWSLVVAP